MYVHCTLDYGHRIVTTPFGLPCANVRCTSKVVCVCLWTSDTYFSLWTFRITLCQGVPGAVSSLGMWACGLWGSGYCFTQYAPPPHTMASGKLLFLLTLPCARVIRLQIHRWMCVYVLHSIVFGPSLHFLKLPCTRLQFQGCALCMRGGILKRWIHFMQYLLKTKVSNFSDYPAPADYVYRRCCACMCLEVFDKCL